MSDSTQGPSGATPSPSYFPRHTRPGEAMKVLTRRVEHLNQRIHQRLTLGNANGVSYDEAERNAVLWALDTVHHLCRRLLGPLRDATVVCDRCSVKLETRVTVNGELRVCRCVKCYKEAVEGEYPLLYKIYQESEEAKQLLRSAGFGVTGMPLLTTVEEALSSLREDTL